MQLDGPDAVLRILISSLDNKLVPIQLASSFHSTSEDLPQLLT